MIELTPGSLEPRERRGDGAAAFFVKLGPRDARVQLALLGLERLDLRRQGVQLALLLV